MSCVSTTRDPAPIRERTVSSNAPFQRLRFVTITERVMQRTATDVGERQHLEHVAGQDLVDHVLEVTADSVS